MKGLCARYNPKLSSIEAQLLGGPLLRTPRTRSRGLENNDYFVWKETERSEFGAG